MLNDPLNIISLTGDGVQTVFDVPFKIWDVAELEVSILTASGASTIVSDWTATISPGGLGGTVTYPTAGDPLPSGDKIVVRRVVPIQQKVDLVHANRVLPDVVENALDRLTAMVAQNAEEVDRAVKGAPGQTATDYLNELDADRAAAELAAQNAQAAQTAAEQAQTAAETAAGNAEASAIRAETAAEQAELPIASPGEEGKVLTVSPSLGPEWAEVPEELPPYSVADEGKILKVSSLGETEWGMEEKELPSYTLLDAGKTLTVNAGGDAVEWTEPPKGSVNIAPQTIVRAQVGFRPDGWTAADCDAPVLSMVGPSIVPHAGYVGPSGTVSASGEDTTYYAWKAFNGITTSDGLSCWFSAANTGTSAGSPAWLKYAFSVPRLLGDTVYLTARDWTTVGNPKDFEIRGVRLDDSEDVLATYTGQPVATRGQKLTYAVAPAAVLYKAAYVYITGSNGATFVAIDELEFTFADAPAGHLGVLSGLQVAYADSGGVQLSGVLAAPQSVDLSAAADGTHYVYADIAEDGTFSGFGATAVAPEVGVEKVNALADHFNPATVTHYDSADNPIRRVYLGWVEKVSGAITDVHCYSLGTTVVLPITDGVPFPKNTNAIEELPYVYFSGAYSNPQIFAEGKWGATGWIYYTGAGGQGLTSSVLPSGIQLHSGLQALSAQSSSSGGDFAASVAGPCRARVIVRRGY